MTALEVLGDARWVRDGYYLDARVAAEYDASIGGAGDVVRDDVPFYVELALGAQARGERMLELGCGTGRVTIPIAAAGVSITGLDASAAMLEMARGKSDGVDNPRWVEADMTSFELDERFGLVIVPFRSFQLLLSDAEQKACLRCARKHLVEGGRLALNIVNPRLLVEASRLGVEGSARRVDGAVVGRIERNLRQRYVSREEMVRLFALTGFEVEALSGWFDGRAFDEEESSEMVWVARKPSGLS